MVLPIYDDNPSGRVPVLTILVIAVNVLIFVLVQPHGGTREIEFTYRHATIPCEIQQAGPLTEAELFTASCEPREVYQDDRAAGEPLVFPHKNVWFSVLASLFLHGGWIHLLGNMLFLWVFGNNIEERFGAIGFTLFYLTAGVAATAVQVLADTSSTVPVIGASGAIAGVMGAYLVLFPRARVLTWWPVFVILVVYVPASVVLVLWFLMQFAIDPSSGVAWQAHVGGFAFGALVAFAVRNRLRQLPDVPPRRPPRGPFHRVGPGPPPPAGGPFGPSNPWAAPTGPPPPPPPPGWPPPTAPPA
ncbi:MAG: rhomboid family intramembrane serine protease [Actinomycetes bacterium]